MVQRDTTESREGKALAMLAAFSSVGVRFFDVTMTGIEGEKTGFQTSRPVDHLRRTIGRAIGAAIELRQNYIIRPRANSVTLIQLDDLDSAKAGRVAAHAFMVLETSPGNFQAWVAVKDAPEDLARRLRKGAEADPTASGATRISGSVNFKTKYAPDFPLRGVEPGQCRPRRRRCRTRRRRHRCSTGRTTTRRARLSIAFHRAAERAGRNGRATNFASITRP